ncbi:MULTISPECIES: hypothetical protein [Nocardia]|uniref:hypothetical protein n=1 Tax=Nocardia TaxID=1817 RepID=UPI0013003690|nr:MULTISPECIES: hypothetical protein [Nocardia]
MQAFAAVIGLVASILQVVAFGVWGVRLALIFTPVFFLIFTSAVWPYFRPTARNSSLAASRRRTALIDVEHRTNTAYRVAPDQVITNAHGPILISGILDQLFQHHRDAILRFVDEGHTLRVMLIHPTKVASSLNNSWASHNAEWMSYWRTNCNEALVALDAIIGADLHTHPLVRVRFMTELPPYFGILVGDPNAPNLVRRNPHVRVQPLAVSQFIGKGTVMSFERTRNPNETPYGYFSKDLEAQWSVAIDDVDLVQERVAALLGR